MHKIGGTRKQRLNAAWNRNVIKAIITFDWPDIFEREKGTKKCMCPGIKCNMIIDVCMCLCIVELNNQAIRQFDVMFSVLIFVVVVILLFKPLFVSRVFCGLFQHSCDRKRWISAVTKLHSHHKCMRFSKNQKSKKITNEGKQIFFVVFVQAIVLWIDKRTKKGY